MLLHGPTGFQLTCYRSSVSEDLLCAFELLKPLDGPALRKEMTKAKRKRWVILFVFKFRPHIEATSSLMATAT